VNLEDVRAIVQAVDDRSAAQPLLLPGTVASVFGSGRLEVAMDGDPEDTAIEVTGLFADVAPGDRVMVMFDPPRGVYAVGLVGRTIEAGQVIGHTRRVYESGSEFAPPDLSAQASVTCEYRAGRQYRIDFALNLSTTSSKISNIYGYVENQVSGGQVLDTSDSLEVKLSLGVSELTSVSVMGYRLVPIANTSIETLDVFLAPDSGFPGSVEYVGWFDLTVTDAGPIDSLTTL
jgi:hypothetical protein